MLPKHITLISRRICWFAFAQWHCGRSVKDDASRYLWQSSNQRRQQHHSGLCFAPMPFQKCSLKLHARVPSVLLVFGGESNVVNRMDWGGTFYPYGTCVFHWRKVNSLFSHRSRSLASKSLPKLRARQSFHHLNRNSPNGTIWSPLMCLRKDFGSLSLHNHKSGQTHTGGILLDEVLKSKTTEHERQRVLHIWLQIIWLHATTWWNQIG